jgi:hypothetical protein
MDKSYKAGEKEKKRLMEATPKPEIKRVKKPDRTLPEKIPVKHTHRGEKPKGRYAGPAPDKVAKAMKQHADSTVPVMPEGPLEKRVNTGDPTQPLRMDMSQPPQMDKSKRKEELRKMWFAKYMPKTGK